MDNHIVNYLKGVFMALLATLLAVLGMNKKPVKPVTEPLVGVALTQVWEGYAYVEHALVNFKQYVEKYGWQNVVVGAVPAGLLTVEFTDGGNSYNVFYSKAENKLYAANDAPMFREIAMRQKEAEDEADYDLIKSATSPVLELVRQYPEAKALVMEGHGPAGSGAYDAAWQNIIDGKTPDDLAIALKVFCKITGYNGGVPRKGD